MGRSRSFKEPQAVAGRGIPGPQARNSVYTSSLRFVRKDSDINPSLRISRLLKVTGSNWLLILTAVQPTTLVQSATCALHSSSSGSPCFFLILHISVMQEKKRPLRPCLLFSYQASSYFSGEAKTSRLLAKKKKTQSLLDLTVSLMKRLDVHW